MRDAPTRHPCSDAQGVSSASRGFACPCTSGAETTSIPAWAGHLPSGKGVRWAGSVGGEPASQNGARFLCAWSRAMRLSGRKDYPENSGSFLVGGWRGTETWSRSAGLELPVRKAGPLSACRGAASRGSPRTGGGPLGSAPARGFPVGRRQSPATLRPSVTPAAPASSGSPGCLCWRLGDGDAGSGPAHPRCRIVLPPKSDGVAGARGDDSSPPLRRGFWTGSPRSGRSSSSPWRPWCTTARSTATWTSCGRS